MSKIRVISMAAGTVACALSIGFFMQRDSDTRQPQVSSQTTVQTTDVVDQALDTATAPMQPVGQPENQRLNLQGIVLTSAQPEPPAPVTLRQPQLDTPTAHDTVLSSGGSALPDAPKDPIGLELGCAVSAQADPAPIANVNLSIEAPCYPNERVTVHHSGMMFTTVTDDSGQVQVTIPALSERPIFIADFGNGKGAVVTASVPDLKTYDRVVLQWSGDAGFQIHAREFGAGYGDRGHVWMGAKATRDGGSITRLGVADTLAPKLAEIYTYPSGVSDHSGTVVMSIETEVTATNCGRDVTAQTLELRGGTSLRTQDISLAMPSCSAIGDFLVLNNLVDDLTIAAK